MKRRHEVRAIMVGKKWVVEIDLGNPGNCTEDNIFQTRLRGSRHGDCIAVAAKPRRDPEHMDFCNWRCFPLCAFMTGSTVIGEWCCTGYHLDASPFAACGPMEPRGKVGLRKNSPRSLVFDPTCQSIATKLFELVEPFLCAHGCAHPSCSYPSRAPRLPPPDLEPRRISASSRRPPLPVLWQLVRPRHTR